eukprot:SAG11_NODE_1026_length_6141_cov_13.737008_2_plen_126_part_00
MVFGTDRIARLLKPFVLPPRHFRDGSAVYVFVARRSPAFYIGMAIDVQRRIMSHITVSRTDARLDRESAHPSSDTTMRELQSEVTVLLRRMGRTDDTLPQLPQTWTNQNDPVPPQVDAKRAKALA